MLRRLLIAALFLGVGALPTIGQDKKDDKDKKVEKKDDVKDKDKKDDKDKKGEKALLKWKFDSKMPFYQKMVTETKQTMKVQNQDVNQTQKQTFYFVWNPGKQEGDYLTIKQKIEGVAMEIDIGQQKISYDSTKGKDAGNNPLGEFFNALKDSEFTITLDTKTMKVTKVEGRQDFLDKLIKANPQMKGLLEQILSENALKEMAEPTFAAIPGKEVTKGDTWKRESTLDMGPIGKYENVYTYTYEGKDNKLDKIKVETTLKYVQPGDVAGAGTQGLPFKIKSADLKSSSATGVILFDPEKGWISKSDMKLDLSGKLGIEIGGQTTDVTLTQTQTSTVETSDKSLVPAAKP